MHMFPEKNFNTCNLFLDVLFFLSYCSSSGKVHALQFVGCAAANLSGREDWEKKEIATQNEKISLHEPSFWVCGMMCRWFFFVTDWCFFFHSCSFCVFFAMSDQPSLNKQKPMGFSTRNLTSKLWIWKLGSAPSFSLSLKTLVAPFKLT